MRCFEAAARHNSYSHAANELSISQAAVSQQVRNLEQGLGVKLFVRRGHSMLLTPQGKTLHEHVQRAFNDLLNGFDRIQIEPQSGVLIVSTTLSFASIWLVPRLWKFAEAHPGIKVKVMVSDELEDVRHSEIDVAIRQGDSTVDNVEQRLLFTDPVFPVCSPSQLERFPLSSPEAIECCNLLEANNPGRFSWEHWFAIVGAEYQPDKLSWIEPMSWEMAINSVVTGQGICLAPSILVKQQIDNGILVRPFKQQIEPGLRFTFIYDPESPRQQRIKLFYEWLKAELDAYFEE